MAADNSHVCDLNFAVPLTDDELRTHELKCPSYHRMMGELIRLPLLVALISPFLLSSFPNFPMHLPPSIILLPNAFSVISLGQLTMVSLTGAPPLSHPFLKCHHLHLAHLILLHILLNRLAYLVLQTALS